MKTFKYFLPFVLGMLALCWGCDKDNDKPCVIPEGAVTEKFKVLYAAPPDNCNDFVLVVEKLDEDGKLISFTRFYKPNTLPAEFQKDGMFVVVTYTVSNDTHNCDFGGYVPVINVHHIRKY